MRVVMNSSWTGILPNRWVIGISTLGPIGRWGKAPGTNGSFVGLLYYTVFFHGLSAFPYLVFLFLSSAFAVAICGEAEIRLGQRDPKIVILDELVAIPLCFLGLQAYINDGSGWAILLIGFLLFRFFDILKPFGIKRLQRLRGGYGVVVDDLAAGLATCVTLHIGLHFWKLYSL